MHVLLQDLQDLRLILRVRHRLVNQETSLITRMIMKMMSTMRMVSIQKTSMQRMITQRMNTQKSTQRMVMRNKNG